MRFLNMLTALFTEGEEGKEDKGLNFISIVSAVPKEAYIVGLVQGMLLGIVVITIIMALVSN